MKIYVKTKYDYNLPVIKAKGDWIDLQSAEDVEFNAPVVKDNDKVYYDYKTINLGVAMKLPDGCEAIVLPRSSLFKKKGLILVNSAGVIDETYQGNNDFWHFLGVAFRKTTVWKGESICQFRVQLSQKATLRQKLKYIFDNKIEIVQVSELPGPDRGGVGSTGGMKYGN